jgi:hypothetical protein
LNNSAKTYRRLLETKCEKNKELRGKKKTLEKEGSSEAQGQAARSNKQRQSQLLFFCFFFLERKRLGLQREAHGQGKRPARAGCFRGVSGSDSSFIFPFLDVPFSDSFFLFFGKNQNRNKLDARD